MSELFKLNKGIIRLTQDRLIIEGDGAARRKWRNILIVSLYIIAMVAYVTSIIKDEGEIDYFRLMVRVIIWLMLLYALLVERVILYSTRNEILYSDIRNYSTADNLFSVNRGLRIFLSNSQARTLRFEKGELKRFLHALEVVRNNRQQ